MSDQHFDKTFSADIAENYERFFVPAIGRPVAAGLLRAAALQPGERVLDVGCGTGIVARLAAEQVGVDGVVAGLDVNPGMLAVARAVAPQNAVIEWHQASAEEMPLPDGSFDAVLCQLSLQFIPDRVGALREMRRVLVPGGRLLLNVPGPTAPVFEVFAESIGRHVAPEAAGFVRQVFSLHDVTELRGLMEDAGLENVDVDAQVRELTLPGPREFLWQYTYSTPLGAMMAQVDDATRSALERDVVTGWREFEVEGGMNYRQRVVIARGSRPPS